MSEFEGLDLQAVESQLEESPDEDDVITPEDGPGVRLVLDILDGSTPDSEWIELVESGAVLVLNVEGDMNTLAAGFGREIYAQGGELMHFRDFLLVAPPGVDLDASRL
jgi:hypothetical protein